MIAAAAAASVAGGGGGPSRSYQNNNSNNNNTTITAASPRKYSHFRRRASFRRSSSRTSTNLSIATETATKTKTTTSGTFNHPLTSHSPSKPNSIHNNNNNNHHAPIDPPMTPPAENRLKLLPLIAEYRAKQWITSSQEISFMKRLQQSPKSNNPFDQTHVQKVQKELQDIANQHKAREREDEEASQQQPQSNGSHHDRVIFETSDFIDRVDETTLQHWFVEMCFFARLGFLQPPSCLQCLYREAILNETKTNDIAECRNMLLWRKNAKVLLHPQTLNGGDLLCVVECQAVQKLLDGEIVDSYQWDQQRKELIYHM